MTKNVLLLGAGLVAGPIVKYLSEKGICVTVASRTLAKAEKLCTGLRNCKAVQFDIEKEGYEVELVRLTEACDVVVSLLPWVFHLQAAKIAIQLKKHFCTSSYVSDEMQALNEETKKLGLIFINECGVDPGLDHMSATQLIDRVHAEGDKVVSFESFCGGLPAPDCNNNPFGYKLSWSPRGVLLATGKRDAKFLRDGAASFIAGPEVFHKFNVDTVPGLGTFEAYPNGDSTKYREIYRIPEVQTLVRGTYRYPGWCGNLQKMLDLGLLSMEAPPAGSYLHMTALAVGAANEDRSTVENAIKAKLGSGDHSGLLTRLEWLGLLDAKKSVPESTKSHLDACCALMDERMQYAPGERDMIAMQHTFVIEKPDGKKAKLVSSLAAYGIPNGDTAMAITVSVPLAIAVRMVLEGSFTVTGIVRPTIPELYNPILAEMSESFGITFVEKAIPM